MRAIAQNKIMANWKPQSIEKSREMKLAAQKTIDAARAKKEMREFLEQQRIKHARVAPAVEVDYCDTLTHPEKFGKIFDAVCKALMVDPADVRSRMRHPRVVATRMIVVYLTRKHTLLSYPDIQVLMGSSATSHSTAMTQHQRIDELMMTQPHAPMFLGDTRTFRDMVESFDGSRLCFKEVENG